MQHTEAERREQEDRKEKYIRDFQRKHFGNNFEGASLSQSEIAFRASEQQQISQWFKASKDFLVMIGPPGTGKTHMCAALTGHALRKFNTVRVWREQNLFTHLRDAIERYGDYINTLKCALDDEFCVIDDIGSTPVNDWRKEIIFNAIDIRREMGYPTVLTSNYNQFELTNKYEARVTSRLFGGRNTIVDLFGMEDLRARGY